MCNNDEFPFIYFDFETCNITHLAIDEISVFPNLRIPMPTNNQCSYIIMYNNLFPLTPSMNSFNDLIPFPTTWF